MPEEKDRNVWHEVQPDEDLAIIAADYRIKDYKLIYDHPENAELRQKRPDPHILYKGDKVWIPEIDPEKFKVKTNETHRFVLHYPRSVFHIFLRNDDGEPYDDIRYEIWIGGNKFDPTGKNKELRTRKDGLIHHLVPVNRTIELRVWWEDEPEEKDEEAADSGGQDDTGQPEPEYESILLYPGHLDPIDTLEGVQDRLAGLNYDCGDDPHGEIGKGTEAALFEFQKDYDLVPTGEIDDLTRMKLKKGYGA